MSFNVENRNSLIIPILDKTNESISALYYLKYSGSDIETYLFMNDHDDAAYSYLSRMIQYFEKIMNLKISNDDIIVTIKGSDGTKKTKARSEIMETCYSWEQLWIDSNGKSHYDPYKECFIHIEVRSDFHTSRGDWNLNSSGNYKPNDSYNGGSGNGNGEPEPIDPVEITKKQIQKDLCNTFNGIVNISSIKENIDELSLPQEQFIIGLANIAAMSELGLPFTSLKNDLGNYPNDSNLYSKLNKLNNHEKYTANWERTGNSNANCDYALISPEINSSGFQLKFYPEKNGEYNALGLVKDGLADHTIEGALEYIEGWLRDNQGFEDDFLYDMHLYNALNFMEDYCND
ncbi:hypothetical protein QUH73_20635 [Labilibaculum sp. K2S]|uniref:hypothetical protein n=1 Tax=Labilibaculum sp. K2S TaxID=3056386 RepID=UPI0025A42AEA|nr:hypothetical protein [Labilibaculum sp. K2S]MDM8162233.1 hypothetical protein [Labilibaculum sp. K2S]